MTLSTPAGGLLTEDPGFLCRLVVPFDIVQVSPNKRLHWARRAELTKLAHRACAAAWIAYQRPVAPPGGVNVRFTLLRSRAMDEDNAVACLKAIIDGLFHGLITVDDSPKYVHIIVVDQRPHKSHRADPTTIVEVWRRGE